MVREFDHRLNSRASYGRRAAYIGPEGMRADLLYRPRHDPYNKYLRPVCSLMLRGTMRRFLPLSWAITFTTYFMEALDFSLVPSMVEISLDGPGDDETKEAFYKYLWRKWGRNKLGLYGEQGKEEDGLIVSRAEARMKRDTLRDKYDVYQIEDLIKIPYFDYLSKRFVWVQYRGGKLVPHPINEKMQAAIREFDQSVKGTKLI